MNRKWKCSILGHFKIKCIWPHVKKASFTYFLGHFMVPRVFLKQMFKLPLNLIMIHFNKIFIWQNRVKMTKLLYTACEAIDQPMLQTSWKLFDIALSLTTETDGLTGPDGDPILTVTSGRTGNWKLKALTITIYITNNKLISKMVFSKLKIGHVCYTLVG